MQHRTNKKNDLIWCKRFMWLIHLLIINLIVSTKSFMWLINYLIINLIVSTKYCL